MSAQLWLGGPIVWALHFATLHGIDATACASRSLPVVVTLVALAAIAAVIAVALHRTRRPDGAAFMDKVAILLGIASLAGIVATTMPLLLIPPCL